MIYEVLWNFEILRNQQILARKSDIVLIHKKKKRKNTFHLMDFVVPVDYKVKIKEIETINEYLDLARELGKL